MFRKGPIHEGAVPWQKRVLVLGFGLLLLLALSGNSLGRDPWTGRDIMKEASRRHQRYPYVFEAQTVILTDDAGNRDVRKVRSFFRLEQDGSARYLLVVDDPPEVRGVALLAIRDHSGSVDSGIYLPAFGKELKSGIGDSRGGLFFGTDFAVEDLTAEVLSDFRYVRAPDRKIGKIVYFVVDAFPGNKSIEGATGYSLRRHFIRQDNFFIVRTDFFDRRGRFFKRQTWHDIKRLDREIWGAGMTLMENLKEGHKTLIKIDRRVFSHDYVRQEIFTPSFLFENRHIESTGRLLENP